MDEARYDAISVLGNRVTVVISTPSPTADADRASIASNTEVHPP
jgi:hypothetical protein